jgi:hypothetical protein
MHQLAVEGNLVGEFIERDSYHVSEQSQPKLPEDIDGYSAPAAYCSASYSHFFLKCLLNYSEIIFVVDEKYILAEVENVFVGTKCWVVISGVA